jgi:twitching motility two-component system response regulator PilH
MDEIVERRQSGGKWYVEGKTVEISFLDERFQFNWEVAIELSTGLLVGDAIGLEENGEAVAEAIKIGLYQNRPPAVILLGNRSNQLLEDAKRWLAERGIQVPLQFASNTQEIRKYEIQTALEQFEKRITNQEIKGRTKRQVALEILKALLSTYVQTANRIPKQIEKRKAGPARSSAPLPTLSLAATPSPAADPEAKRTKRVLIAEDSLTGLKLIEKALTDAGYETVTAMDGEEADRKIRTEPLDAAVIDIVMPKKNGYQVCRELRKDPNYQYLPIIFISSKNEASDRIWGLRQGANEYLVKPFQMADLVNTLRKYVPAS